MKRSVEKIVAVIVVLSLLDLYLTVLGINRGIISEGNPLMGSILSRSYEGFLAAKLGITFLFMLILTAWGGRFKWVKRPLIVVLAAYLGVMVLHAHWLLIS